MGSYNPVETEHLHSLLSSFNSQIVSCSLSNKKKRTAERQKRWKMLACFSSFRNMHNTGHTDPHVLILKQEFSVIRKAANIECYKVLTLAVIVN